MDFNDPKIAEMYLDFLWQTGKCCQNTEETDKAELDHYKDLVKALSDDKTEENKEQYQEGYYGLDSMGDVGKVKGR